MILKYDKCLIYASHNKGSVSFELTIMNMCEQKINYLKF